MAKIDQSSQDAPAESAEPDWPKPFYAWYVVILLMLVYMLSFVDRTIIVLLIEPIKRDMGLSDTQISLLYGFAFAIFYTFFGIPIARLADSQSRRRVIAIGLTIWSLMTALCGLSKNFGQLFAARVGVGVGEAALSPAAYSLICDYFPEDKRAGAMSVYTMGLYLGIGMAVLLGGYVINLVDQLGSTVLPVVGEVYGWQLTFIVVGLPGLLFSLLMYTVREPLRRGEQVELAFAEAIGYFLTRWRFYGSFCIGMSFLVMYSYALTAWIPSYFFRTFGWTMTEVSVSYGTTLLITGPSGILFGGWLATKLRQRGDDYANARLGVISLGLLIIPASVVTLVDDGVMSLGLIGLVKFICGLPLGVAVAALLEVTPSRLRAQAIAIYMFIINIIGIGMGPLSVALLTDYVFEDDASLRYSMAIVGTAASLAGFFTLGYAFRQFKRLQLMELSKQRGPSCG